MIHQYIQSLFSPALGVQGQTAPALGLPGDNARSITNALRRLRAMLAEIDRRHSMEYQNRKAIAHLRSLTDAQLRDIGIRRHDIETCVREGRNSI